MKSLLILLMFVFSAYGLSYAQSGKDGVKGPQIAFKELSHDFGDITEGDKVEYTFKFANTGTDPLIISEVVTACGCTGTTWTKGAVLPGKEGEIVAIFNSANKMGRQNKVITILSNAVNTPVRISIVTNVLPKK